VVFLEFKNISSFARGALSTRRSCLVFALLFAGLSPASWSGAVDVPVERSGARVYQSVSALCHETRVGPPLLGRQLPPDLVRYFVRHGRNGMPTFRVSEISEAELVATARYVAESAAPVAPVLRLLRLRLRLRLRLGREVGSVRLPASRVPPRRAGHFLCFAKESNQRKATPDAAPAARVPCGARVEGALRNSLRLRLRSNTSQ